MIKNWRRERQGNKATSTLILLDLFLKRKFFVVVDAHSKWLEVVPVPNLTSQTAIDTLRSIFTTHGLPELLVSDNGPSFTSAEFQEFMKRNGI